MLFRQSVKVGLGRHVGIEESVLDSCRCADVLVEELLARLLRDGFGRHDCLGVDWPERTRREADTQMLRGG